MKSRIPPSRICDESPDIPMSAIRRYARQIVEKFQPEQVILFGSYSRGEQREGSDVDVLVVMPCANHTSQAIRIRLALRAPFAMDLLVRSPERLRQRLLDGDWFLREIVETGKVLYDVSDKSRCSVGFSPRFPGNNASVWAKAHTTETFVGNVLYAKDHRRIAVDYRHPGESAGTPSKSGVAIGQSRPRTTTPPIGTAELK